MATSDTRTYAGREVAHRRADRRAQFIAAAVSVYGDKGFAAATVADVCAAAKLSRRQFYELFDSPEDLLIAAYDDTQRIIGDAVTAALASGAETDPASVARKAMHAYLEALRGEPLRVRLAYVEVVGVSDRVEAHREHTREQWAEVIAGIVAGLPGARPLSPDRRQLAAAAFIGAVNGLVHRWSLHQPGHPVDELAETLADILIVLYTDS